MENKRKLGPGKGGQIEWYKEFVLDDIELGEIARLIKEGYTSGLMGYENRNIYWELKINSWIED